nr:DUF1934 domain-containing protein [uncultured Mediterraneibacter sp.]
MTKDVLVSISGMHDELAEVAEIETEEAEAIEVITPANYYFRNQKHYIVYDEAVEGTTEVIKNRIKITGTDCVEIMKSGLSNSHMVFERNKKNETFYRTPYGQMLVGVNTKNMEINVSENNIDILIDYQLDVNHEPMADCKIKMNITSKNSGDFSVIS